LIMDGMIQFISAHLTNLVGVLFFGIGAFRLVSQYIFLKSAIATVGHLKGWNQDREFLWKPIVVFTTNEGRKIEFISDVGSNPRPTWEIDRPVKVVYDPAKPEKAYVYSFFYFWLLPICFFALGLAFMLHEVAWQPQE